LKKASFSAILSTAIVCYFFWLLITGQVVSVFTGEADVMILAAGAVVSLGTALFSARFFIHKRAFHLWHPVRLLKVLWYAAAVFPWELIKANVDVARRALSPKLPVNPGIVKVPVKVESEYGRFMLANSITLTPGTITMDAAEEDGTLYYYIHWIDVASTDPETAGEQIKGTLETWARGIWE